MLKESLKNRIAGRRNIRIAVIGVGYVGLPLAVRMANMGFEVLGVDISPEVINHLKQGKSRIEMVGHDQIHEVVKKTKKLKPLLVNRETHKTSGSAIRELMTVDVFIVCADTPLHAEHGWEPDIRWIQKSAELIERVQDASRKAKKQKKELLVILESTSYPGTTKKVFSPLVDKFKGDGVELYLAYSPERTNPGPRATGQAKQNQKEDKGSDPFTIPRILGGLNKASLEVALTLYGEQKVFSQVREVDSLEAAEMIKLLENTFRFVSIAFANEMALIARLFGLNIWELLTAVRTKDFGLDLCLPGLIGGHCIPIDPHYLAWAVRNEKRTANLIDVAQKAHQDLKEEAVNLILRLLNNQKKCVLGASVLFFGVAYKKNISDIRESAVIDLMKRFASYGAEVSFWDPLFVNGGIRKPLRLEFTEAEIRQHPNALKNHAQLDEKKQERIYLKPKELIGSWDQIEDTCSQYDCIVLGTNHDCFHPAYMNFDRPAFPAVADLCDAFRSSAEPGCPLKDMLASVRKNLERSNKYVLLGVH